MRILLLTLCYLPDIAPNAPVMTALAEGLAELGHELVVLTAHPHYGQGEVAGQWNRKTIQRDRNNGIETIRIPVFVGKSDSSINKIASWVSFNIIGTIVSLALKPADLIIAPSPPLTLGLSESFLGRLWGVPYIYNPQDIYPDVAVEQGFLRNEQAINLLYKIEKFIYDKAAAVTVISESHRLNLLAKGVPAHKLHIIPNFVDTDFLKSLPRQNRWAEEHNLNGRVVVTYAGNIGASQGLETLLQAAYLIRERKNIVFLIIGRGTEKTSLEAEIRELGLEQVRLMPFQPLESLPEVYAAADMQVVLLKKGMKGSVPSKTYGIMASARPLIASVEEASEVAKIIQKSQAGLLVPPQDPRSLADSILALAADAEERRAMGARGREFVVSYYSKQAVAKQYDELIRVIKSKRK